MEQHRRINVKKKAGALKLKPMAVFRSFAVAGVHRNHGVGPAYAVPKALKKQV